MFFFSWVDESDVRTIGRIELRLLLLLPAIAAAGGPGNKLVVMDGVEGRRGREGKKSFEEFMHLEIF